MSLELGGRTRALVTGGAGFLGGAIVRQLVARGVCVRSFQRSPSAALEKIGVEVLQGDLRRAEAVREACAGCDVVFHAAAKAGVWGPRDEFHAINTLGTRNVVEACRSGAVPRLVYTSTPSVVFDGRDLEGADESLPHAEHFESAYAETKALGERIVLEANSDDLATVSLRPHLVWGPGDPHFLPRILARARAGRLLIVGDNRNRIDTVYIDNAADAHLLAAERLVPGAPPAGRAYFVTQGEPLLLWEMVNRILQAAGEPRVERRMPARAAYVLGALLEGAYRLLRISAEPPMTRFLARELSTAHWFDISAARRDLGYEPRVSLEEGLDRLARWCQEAAP